MDINKQIEGEAREYANDVFDSFRGDTPMHSEDNKVFCINDFSAGYNACLHSSRWRKVSEELPELGVEVLITRNDGVRFLSWLDKDSELFFNVSDNEEYFLDEIQSWKPID